jgi:hypothetical protein
LSADCPVRGDEKVVSNPCRFRSSRSSESSDVPHDSALASYYGLDGFHDGGGFLVLPEPEDDPASWTAPKPSTHVC